ncbi:MAG: hypothetical protein ABSH49_35680 [Bryobacteraceae bacterium]
MDAASAMQFDSLRCVRCADGTRTSRAQLPCAPASALRAKPLDAAQARCTDGRARAGVLGGRDSPSSADGRCGARELAGI